MKVQVYLASGTLRRTCWIEADRGVKVGDSITIKKEDDRLWKVRTLSSPHATDDIKSDWKVGGL